MVFLDLRLVISESTALMKIFSVFISQFSGGSRGGPGPHAWRPEGGLKMFLVKNSRMPRRKNVNVTHYLTQEDAKQQKEMIWAKIYY